MQPLYVFSFDHTNSCLCAQSNRKQHIYLYIHINNSNKNDNYYSYIVSHSWIWHVEGIVPQEIIEMQFLCGLETGWWQCESSPTILQPYQDLNPGVFPWFSISCLVAIFVFLLFSIPAFFLVSTTSFATCGSSSEKFYDRLCLLLWNWNHGEGTMWNEDIDSGARATKHSLHHSLTVCEVLDGQLESPLLNPLPNIWTGCWFVFTCLFCVYTHTCYVPCALLCELKPSGAFRHEYSINMVNWTFHQHQLGWGAHETPLLLGRFARHTWCVAILPSSLKAFSYALWSRRIEVWSDRALWWFRQNRRCHIQYMGIVLWSLQLLWLSGLLVTATPCHGSGCKHHLLWLL